MNLRFVRRSHTEPEEPSKLDDVPCPSTRAGGPPIPKMQMHLSHVFYYSFAKIESSSFLAGMPNSLGIHGVAVLLVGACVFLGACLVVALRKRPAVIASYSLFLLFPLLVGVHGAIADLRDGFDIIAHSNVRPHPSEIAYAESRALEVLSLGVLTTWPSLFVVAIGLLVRTLRSRETSPNASD